MFSVGLFLLYVDEMKHVLIKRLEIQCTVYPCFGKYMFHTFSVKFIIVRKLYAKSELSFPDINFNLSNSKDNLISLPAHLIQDNQYGSDIYYCSRHGWHYHNWLFGYA